MGSFGAFNRRKDVIRMPVNPMDKCTIVSVYPFEINEVKHTIFPGRFIIPGAKENDFEILVVGPSSWFKEMEEGQPSIEIPNSSIQIAESVIKDYMNGLVGCNMADSTPGLFFVPGAFTKEQIAKNCIAELAIARGKQKNYWNSLVKMADVDWSRTNGNPLSISDLARLAANLLGLDKPWLRDFSNVQLEKCPACGQLVDIQFPICQHCHTIINEDAYKKAGLKKAV